MAIDNVVEQPIARVKGDLLLKLPEDLYIPPDALEVFLDTFEGPLDLLLYLIRRQNFDILNIPIAHITTQYISYIEMMDKLHLELAAEYLLMAALLAEIKSRMLLPRRSDPEDEYDDPRVYLIKKLQEYECIKKAAEEIELLPRYQRDIFDTIIDISDIEVTKRHPEVDLQELLFAFQDVLKRVEQLSHHHITKEPLSVRERMAAILEKLSRADSLAFSTLFTRSEGKGGVVVSFLAILELNKEGLLEIIQLKALAELRIRAKKTA
ncbi:MAG: segregation/condensation protein A [Methylococcales symbiont of Iophon sp. n. MRB-2018]|nr:MAG: segregation/condensation protein A [Methylococcales symbiont of Iophon sp. n. MRB-2018]KAF3979653.1 MAG: segregation/condensation protein A [Methylococcales symbiont of Iophon sp. n. MRB-2018]